MPKFERVPEIVEAVQINKLTDFFNLELSEAADLFWSNDLRSYIRKGDYIVTIHKDVIRVIPQAEFERKFRRIE